MEPETSTHAVFNCPARIRARDLLLKEVSSLGPDAQLWSDPLLVRALGEYIPDTKTGFAPDMLPDR